MIRSSAASLTWLLTAGGGPACRPTARSPAGLATAVKDIMTKKVGAKSGLESAQRETQVMLEDDIKMMQ